MAFPFVFLRLLRPAQVAALWEMPASAPWPSWIAASSIANVPAGRPSDAGYLGGVLGRNSGLTAAAAVPLIYPCDLNVPAAIIDKMISIEELHTVPLSLGTADQRGCRH